MIYGGIYGIWGDLWDLGGIDGGIYGIWGGFMGFPWGLMGFQGYGWDPGQFNGIWRGFLGYLWDLGAI